MKQFYIGTYVNGGADSLFKAEFNEQTAALHMISATNLLESPSYIAPGRGGLLCAVIEKDGFMGAPESGGLAMLKSDGDAFTLLDAQPTMGGAPCHVIFGDGQMIYVANYMGGSLSAFEWDEKTNKLHLVQVIKHEGSGISPNRQQTPHVHSCGFMGGLLYAADLSLDALCCYRPTSKGLIPEPLKDIRLPKGSGVRHFISSKRYPDTVFAICELSNEIMMIDVSARGGSLLQTLSTLPEPKKSHASAIKQSTDGRYLFASNRGDDSIALFSLSDDKREMQLLQIVHCEGKTPRDFHVMDDHVIVCNQDSSDIAIFHFDAVRGQLRYSGDKIPCPKPVCIVEIKG